jgi:hypothetical protein
MQAKAIPEKELGLRGNSRVIGRDRILRRAAWLPLLRETRTQDIYAVDFARPQKYASEFVQPHPWSSPQS